MSPGAILGVFVAFVGAELAWETLLISLNMRHVARNASEVPQFFRELWERRKPGPPEEIYERSVRYTLARGSFAVVAQAVSAAVVVAVAAGGALGWLDVSLSTVIPLSWVARLVFVFAVGLFLQLTSLPFGLYGQFVIEQRFGFNTMRLGLWFLDRAKGLVLSLLLLTPLLLGLFWFMSRAGSLWWLYAAGMVILFQVGLSVLYPAVISPLFNKFTPLEQGSLQVRVMELARRLDFGVRGIFVMDASRRSRHSNAYFTGIGRAKRIVFYDTLLKRATQEQVLAVLAHEIGHQKLGHVRKELAFSGLATVAGLWVVSLLLAWAPLFRAFGFGGPTTHAAVVISALCAGPFTFYLQPLAFLLSRRYEYAADRFAWRAMGTSAPLVEALLDLHADNLSNVAPHPLYSFTHYSHPTLSERVRTLEGMDRRSG